MSRFTKFLVIASNLTALWLTATLVSRGIPSIFVPTLAAFALSLTLALLAGDRVTGVVLSLIYFVPAFCFAWFSSFVFSYYAIWMAALCGAMLPRAFWSRWAFPGRFAFPLVLWALVLALSWPLVVLREVDFVPSLLSLGGMVATRLPQSPTVVAVWISCVVSIALTGLLLIDWLFLVYPTDRAAVFERQVIWPMFGGVALAALVALYQAIGNPAFLNQTFFQSFGRVVGTMRDANAFGAVAALWLPVPFAMAIDTTVRPVVRVAWLGMLVILVAVVWASGSRTALMAALIGLFVVAWHARRFLSRRQVIAAVIVASLACAVVATVVPSTSVGRARAMLPSTDAEGLKYMVYQLWYRDLYGNAAMQMIEEHPLVGIGVGGFNYQYGEVLYRVYRSARPPDNAQNWYRQQLAELGLIGSLGWIAWLGLLGWMMLRRPDVEGRRVMAGAVKGGVLGLAAASMLGVPGQDAAVSISLVVVLCWCMKLKGLDADRDGIRLRGPHRWEWAAILAVVVCFLAGTAQVARAELRPPLRAIAIDFPYSYGFVPDKTDPSVRWTRARAVEVFTADQRWLKLVIGDVAPDAAEKPVQVNIRINRTSILRVSRRSNFPVTRWVRMPAYGTPLLMEIDVDRTFHDPSGAPGDREVRGVAIREWSFSYDDPPKGSVTVESLGALPL